MGIFLKRGEFLKQKTRSSPAIPSLKETAKVKIKSFILEHHILGTGAKPGEGYHWRVRVIPQPSKWSCDYRILGVQLIR